MKKSRACQIFEAVFIIGYLIFDLIAALIFFSCSQSQVLFLFGWLTVILAGSDAFHLSQSAGSHLWRESFHSMVERARSDDLIDYHDHFLYSSALYLAGSLS